MAFWLILALVFGVVIGNLMLLKHTANMKMPSLKQRHSESDAKTKDEQDSSKPSAKDD
ncbi:DUF2897 family protein [Pseudidiomarina sp. 1ASP75-14]|uniref:DUF2897 family protein n=1 Tax=Pseudidiomarina terrestris TaxID=2820060 RepID=UPI0026559312|nr:MULTISPECIES: DUF2897 family protein [unclassified Pseudidiomarina]MDN7127176.1 DUF2897 family protein [Pseudidiomarina sp. 1APR75-33.1]MDN7138557.1 DUF2897 family protein [Pseudidiomarina sp. 1ASP75-14]